VNCNKTGIKAFHRNLALKRYTALANQLKRFVYNPKYDARTKITRGAKGEDRTHDGSLSVRYGNRIGY
jgi:hypothetical protein